MECFEKELLPNIVSFTMTWQRYVDDIFAIVPHNLDINNFLTDLNSLHPSIKFKVEEEDNSSLPFLDVLVVRSETNYPTFKVYRKPTHSNSYVHAFSNHASDVKLGVISNIFLRAYKVCDNKFLKDEIEAISNSFHKLGYGARFIRKGHSKARRRFYHINMKRTSLQDSKPFLVLPQTGHDNAFLKKSLDKCNITGVFRNTNTLMKYMRKPTESDMPKPCIYEIPCKNCERSYIGETNDLERRTKQHIDSVRRGDVNSALFQHMQNENHSVNINETNIIANIVNTEKRKIVEAILIQSSKTYNIQQSNFHLDNLTSVLLKSHSKYIRRLLTKINNPP